MSVIKSKEMVDQILTIAIPSTVGKIKFVQNIIELLREDLEIDEELFSDVLVATTEALVNAVLHGNRENPAFSVSTRFVITEHYLEVSVEDAGKGFDIEAKVNAFNNINPNMIFGRGLFIIHELADKVTFSADGSCITMLFNKKIDGIWST